MHDKAIRLSTIASTIVRNTDLGINYTLFYNEYRHNWFFYPDQINAKDGLGCASRQLCPRSVPEVCIWDTKGHALVEEP